MQLHQPTSVPSGLAAQWWATGWPGPQAQPGEHRHRRGGDAAGSVRHPGEAARRTPGAVSWSAGASQGLWPDQGGGPYHESQLSFRDNPWPSGLGDFAWNHEDATPQGPSSLLLPGVTEAALSVLIPQRRLGGRS